MGDAVSKVATFSHRPGITSACAGMEISPPKIKETAGFRNDFIVGLLIVSDHGVVDRPPAGFLK